MLGLVILLAIIGAVIGMAYAAYRWHGKRARAEQLLERKQRHLEQQESWDCMVEKLERAKTGASSGASEA